jgi:HEAT repeat protein
MKPSRLRVGLSILFVLIAGGVVGFELKDRLGAEPTADARIRELGSYWASHRRTAAASLAQFAGEADKVVPALVKSLTDSDMGVRQSAMESLKAYGEKSKPAGSLLKEMLARDPDTKTRELAASLLGAIKDPDAIPNLTRALDDPAPAVRIEATWSLGRWGRTVASGPIIDKLLPALRPDHPEDVRDATVEALDAIVRHDERVGRAIADVAVNDPSSRVRCRAVAFMGKAESRFQVPALIAALDDPHPQVRLTAGTSLASIGLTDDRTVPALCRAALHADQLTREGIGMNFDRLVLDRPKEKVTDEELARRYNKLVKELRTALETRDAAAREQMLNVLGTLILKYQVTGKPALLEPARSAAAAVLARFEDEKEEVGVRLHAANQWSVVRASGDASFDRAAASRPAAAARKDDLHTYALWIATMSRALTSPASAIRYRAGEILIDSFKVQAPDAAFREAWRKAVPTLVEATTSEDTKIQSGAVAILSMLGPEALPALPRLRSLARDSQDEALRPAAREAIKSISCMDDLRANDPDARITAAECAGRLGWRATPALPVLVATLKDPEAKVRAAAVGALHALGALSASAVQPLATALAGDADAEVRAAIVGALDAIAPAAPAVIGAHASALRDPDPAVRAAGARFPHVPADDSVVKALISALGDPDDDVRQEVATSLAETLFRNRAVVPSLCRAARDPVQRAAVLEALRAHLAQKNSHAADWSGVANDLPGLRATLAASIPALEQALSQADDEIRPVLFGLLGRIVAFSRMSDDAELRKAIEPALELYLQGLNASEPAIREEVLGRLATTPIRRAESIAALNAFLERSDRPDGEVEHARSALHALANSGNAGAGTPPSPGPAAGRRWTQSRD